MRQAHSHQGSPSAAPVERELSCIQDSCFSDLRDRVAAANRLCVLLFHGMRDENAIRRAIGRLVERHEILRTSYPREGERHCPRLIAGEPDIEILEAEPPATDELIVATGREFAACKIDTDTDSGFRVGLLRLKSGSCALFLVLHPAITDELSQRILARDSVALLLAAAHGREAALPQLPVQYGGYAAWERAALREPDVAKNLELMATELAQCEPWLPAALPSVAGSTLETRSAVLSSQLDTSLIAGISRRVRFERISPHVLALSVFGMMAARWSGSQQLVVGTPVAARQHPALHHVIGAFTDRSFLRIRSDGVQTLRDLFWLIRAASPGPEQLAYSRLDVLRATAGLDPVRLPQANLIVSIADQPAAAQTTTPIPQPGVRILATDESVLPACDRMHPPRTPLNVSLAGESSRLIVRFEYDAAILSLPTVETLMTEFQRLLEQAVYNPGATLI